MNNNLNPSFRFLNECDPFFLQTQYYNNLLQQQEEEEVQYFDDPEPAAYAQVGNTLEEDSKNVWQYTNQFSNSNNINQDQNNHYYAKVLKEIEGSAFGSSQNGLKSTACETNKNNGVDPEDFCDFQENNDYLNNDTQTQQEMVLQMELQQTQWEQPQSCQKENQNQNIPQSFNKQPQHDDDFNNLQYANLTGFGDSFSFEENLNIQNQQLEKFINSNNSDCWNLNNLGSDKCLEKREETDILSHLIIGHTDQILREVSEDFGSFQKDIHPYYDKQTEEKVLQIELQQTQWQQPQNCQQENTSQKIYSFNKQKQDDQQNNQKKSNKSQKKSNQLQVDQDSNQLVIRCTGCDGKYHTFPSFYTHRSLMKKKGFNHEMIKE